MVAIDLSAIPVVDNHCHGIFHTQALDARAWRARCTESAQPGIQQDHVTTTLFYRRLVRELAAFLACTEDEAAIVAARRARPDRALIRDLLRAAHIDALLIDDGFPNPDDVLPLDEAAALGECRAFPMLRLELLMQRLIVACDTLDAVVSALQETLADVRGQGFVALKTIAAYRTGLDIAVWPDDAVQAAFVEARRVVQTTGALRLAHKPLLDTLLHVAFDAAARQELPVQFHVGYGDSDADLLRANPLHLRAVLENPAYGGMSVVLLHECYPYTKEGAYLSAIYENVYLDLSYGIPFVGYDEMAAFTRAACGIAPLSKLLYSSDAVGIPEVHWLSARYGRRIVGEVLGACVASGDLSWGQAETAGEGILRANATGLYRL